MRLIHMLGKGTKDCLSFLLLLTFFVVHGQPSISTSTADNVFIDILSKKEGGQKGLFTIHKNNDKWYFEIPDSILGRPILLNTRFVKTPSGGGYGNSLASSRIIYWEKGAGRMLYLKIMTISNVTKDSTQAIARAVASSNVTPIAAAFEVKARDNLSNTSGNSLVEVTDLFKGDNPITGLDNAAKRRLNIAGFASDRSYIETISTYHFNTEVRTIKTFTIASGSPGTATMSGAEAAGAVTFELENSFLLLPKVPMRKRLFDPRVGYYSASSTIYADSQQRVEKSKFIYRWRLEPRDEDFGKWKRGELVEPKKPIVYYVDPATPKQWRPYIIAGINAWQRAFEKIGFRNAIIGKEWPASDTTMSLEDARYSIISYLAGDEGAGAYLEGPFIADPRTGEILQSRILFSHGFMKWLHDKCMIQASMSDPRARLMRFDENLMGELITWVISHEVGHGLGLRHNFLSSSQTPVEMLRNRAWLETHGHTASIMDYSRFNYVAQPEDHISANGLFGKIGDYDNWAIRWGYFPILNSLNESEDQHILNRWVTDSLKTNARLRYGPDFVDGNPNLDPRAQSEDLGDDAISASEYGIRNLKRILKSLPEWTQEEAGQYNYLTEMYMQLLDQFGLYMDHVFRTVGGIKTTFETATPGGGTYQIVPKKKQQRAVAFLNAQLFTTPSWLLNKSILNKIGYPGGFAAVTEIQSNKLKLLLDPGYLYRIEACEIRYGKKAYTVVELLSDLKEGIWSELVTGQAIDPYRRNIQKKYIDALSLLIKERPSGGISASSPTLINQFNIWDTDVPSIVRNELKMLQGEISRATVKQKDQLSRYHLRDVLVRIKNVLGPIQSIK
ncbi:zinc-dependent metalloprotease [Mucilaginibacter ximonensis]|uniref:Zinc-dependent metalloprotease n=1 Tax=Mucilaginibacter ximonensis TaxID=538021 RepID=A0ABW5Y9S6_9SPHI